MSEAGPTTRPTAPRTFPQTFYQPPLGACQILLVRHGQSAPYVEGQPFPLVAGQGDPPLSDLGQWQASRLGTRLAAEPISTIYVSTLQRTAQTAAPLAGELGLELRVEPDLREVFLGVGEGGNFRRMAADGHPAVVAMRERGEWGEIPGAETNARFQSRAVAAVERIAAAHRDELVVAVCHGGVIGAVLGHAVEQSVFTFVGARNSSISHLVVTDEQWVIRSFNDAAHAGPLTADAEPPT